MSEAALPLEELRGVDKIWHFEQTALFRGLPTTDLTLIANVCSDRIYARDEVILDPGDPANAIFIVNRGCVRLSLLNGMGREKIVSLLQTGGVFGEEILGSESTGQIQAVAHVESWVSILSKAQFLKLVSQRPILALNWIEIITGKLLESREDIRSLSFLDTETRVAQLLIELSRLHGKWIATSKRMIKLKIDLSHEQLAKLIGGNRPHISTIMSKFKKKGWIGYQGRRLLIDPEGLSQAAQPA